MSEANGPVVVMQGIVKNFGPIQALRGIDLHLNPNEVLGLVGDNGAGKSTLMKVLTGVHRPDAGQIYLNGKPVYRIENPGLIDHVVELVEKKAAEIKQIRINELEAELEKANRLMAAANKQAGE